MFTRGRVGAGEGLGIACNALLFLLTMQNILLLSFLPAPHTYLGVDVHHYSPLIIIVMESEKKNESKIEGREMISVE